MLKNRYILLLASTAFFNDRGCHVRILNIYSKIKSQNKVLLCYPGGRKIKNIQSYYSPTLFEKKDYIGFSLKKIILDIFLFIYASHFIRIMRIKYIIAFTHEAGILALLISRFYKIPFILDYQGSFYDEIIKYNRIFKISLIAYIIKYIEMYVEKKANLIIYNTKFNYYNSKKKNKKYIDDDFYTPSKTYIPDFREMKNEKLVFWSGIFTKVQNFELMYDIIKNVCSNRKDIKFIITGFPVPKDIKEQLKNYNVIFTGKIQFDLFPCILKQMDLCISTKIESSEGNSKLFLYKKFCKRTIAYKTRASEEILNNESIVKNSKQIIDIINSL